MLLKKFNPTASLGEGGRGKLHLQVLNGRKLSKQPSLKKGQAWGKKVKPNSNFCTTNWSDIGHRRVTTVRAACTHWFFFPSWPYCKVLITHFYEQTFWILQYLKPLAFENTHLYSFKLIKVFIESLQQCFLWYTANKWGRSPTAGSPTSQQLLIPFSSAEDDFNSAAVSQKYCKIHHYTQNNKSAKNENCQIIRLYTPNTNQLKYCSRW